MKMTTKKNKAAGIVFCILLTLALAVSGSVLPAAALAADTGHVTAVYKIDGVDTQEMDFDLYKVGSIDKGEFKLDAPYSDSGVGMDFSGKPPKDDIMASANTLFTYITANSLNDRIETQVSPDANGNIAMDLEKDCLYLIATDKEITKGDRTYSARPMFIWYSEGNDDPVTIKPTQTQKPHEGVPVEYTVVKHWSGDSATSRPGSVQIELYEDGQLQETVTLNTGNDWSYSWTDEDGEGKWTCVEKNVPSGYSSKVTTAEEGTQLIVTNTTKGNPPNNPTKPDKPGNPSKPRTGDPTTLRWSLIAMGLSGIALIIAGARRRREN